MLIAAAVTIVVAGLAASLRTPAAHPSVSRAMGTCWIYGVYTAVHQPARTGYAHSGVGCDPDFPVYYWRIKFINDGGSALMTADGYYDDWAYYNTPEVSCAGAYVRANMFLNVNGSASSDTEGRQYC
jgi:hypothetical protein